jgi:hypothetical protein
MAEWTRSDSVEGNGYFWTNGEESAFEDTSEGVSRFYAWNGTIDEHDDAGHSHTMPTLDEAVDNLYAIVMGDVEP